MVSSSWLDPEGSATSGVVLSGRLSCGGVVWMGVPERFGNHFGCPPKEGLWVSSCVVPSVVGLRAGNMVGALVGFSASLRPNQNAYTKVEQSKVAEFRPHTCTCPVHGWGYLYP